MRKLYIVEEHHHVLPFWAETAGAEPLDFILTLDHHTDVLPAFSRMEDPPEIDRSQPERAVSQLRHDEHIDWALRAGIMKRSIIIAHENFTEPAHPAMTVIRPEIWPETQAVLDSAPEAYAAAGSVLETGYLRGALQGIDLSGKYILDLDLDNFLSMRSVQPEDPSFFLELAAHAEGVSVSMERIWQKILRLRGETLDSETVLNELNALFRRNKLEFSETHCIVP